MGVEGAEANASEAQGLPARRRRVSLPRGAGTETRFPSVAAGEGVGAGYLPADVAALRGHLPAALLRRACRLAALRRTRPSDELLAAGLDPDLYWSSLAEALGLDYRRDLRDACLPPGAPPLRPAAFARASSVLVHVAGRPVLALAPQPRELARLAARLAETPDIAARMVVVPPAAIRAFLRERHAGQLLEDAVGRLARRYPRLSASRLRLGAGHTLLSVGLLTTGAAIAAAPTTALTLLGVLLTLFFFNCVVWKLAAALARPAEIRCEPLPDPLLPAYSLLVPLYREAAVVADLLRHLAALRYPAARLQILLVCEADDAETLAAIAAAAPGPVFETVIVPPGGPRTKPKALSYALAFARGDCVVVYDAEDRPEPDQLRRAAALFRHFPGLGCIQARLAPDNHGSFLARMFTLEYAANFEILLPALARWGVPLPLGGTSNHFPRKVLDKVGGWDPYNVTEDADLGIRLARFGYRSVTLASRTWEEAPVRLRDWLPQRRRWLKGWIQTALVCLPGRAPARLGLSFRDMLAVHGILTAGIVGLLLYPFTLAAVLAAAHVLLASGASPGPAVIGLVALSAANLVSNLAAAAISAFRGLRAAGALRLAWLIPLLPFYWGLVSLAAWQALLQFIRSPSTWEKTRHGVAPDRSTPPHLRDARSRVAGNL